MACLKELATTQYHRDSHCPYYSRNTPRPVVLLHVSSYFVANSVCYSNTSLFTLPVRFLLYRNMRNFAVSRQSMERGTSQQTSGESELAIRWGTHLLGIQSLHF